MTTERELKTFAAAYIECALWCGSGSGDSDDLRDREEDLDEVTRDHMLAECAAFVAEYGPILEAMQEINGAPRDAYASGGNDFWLTRNGHGAGFWDGDWSYEVSPAGSRWEEKMHNAGEVLDKAAGKAGEYSLYVGDDGKVYGAKD